MKTIFSQKLAWQRIAAAVMATAMTATVAQAAERLSLHAAKADDQIPTELRPALSAPWQNEARDPVSVSYALDMDAPLALTNAPAAVESREYWRKVSGAALSKGVALPLTVPGALLRISELNTGKHATKQVDLVDGEGLLLRNPRGMQQTLAASAHTLYQAGKDQPAPLPFGRGTIAAKLNAELGAGVFTLQSKQALAADAEYLLQVYEPDSPYRLQAKHDTHNVLAGHAVRADGALWRDNKTVPASEVQAVLLAPDGRRLPLSISKVAGHRWQIAEPLDIPTANVPGLWEIEWTLKADDNGVAVERQLRTAFAYAAASARWDNALQFSQRAGSLQLQLPLTVLSAGRYELRAVLSGKDSNGSIRPVVFTSSATWLEPGRRALTLTVAKQLLAEAGVSGTLFVQDLQLFDQSRMAVLQRQAQALSLAESKWRGIARQPSRLDRR